MKENMKNVEVIEGRLYDFDLKFKEVQNKESKYFGKPFITGVVSIATDDAGMNVLDVHYTFITEHTSQNKVDSRFGALKNIMENGKTWVKDGPDAALKLRINSAAALNDFCPQGEDRVVSQQRNESGFITFLTKLCPDGINRHKFTFDALINGVDIKTGADEVEYAQIHCAIFNYFKALLPFNLVARDPGAISYFMSLAGESETPVFTQVWGEITNTTQKVEKTVESAWGEPTVEYSERTAKEWIVTGARPVPYEFDTPDTITREELTKAIQDRNIYLEEVKDRAKKYYESRNAAPAPSAFNTAPTPDSSATIQKGKFNF